MSTLREAMQADIAAAKADIAEKEAKLATLETTFADALSRDVEELKTFVRSIGAHLFPKEKP